MNLKQRFIYKASIGFSLGILIVIVIEALIGYFSTGDINTYAQEMQGVSGGRPFWALMAELLTGGLLGAVGNGGAVVYEIEEWGILKATTIHLGATMLTYILVGLFNGWLTPEINLVNIIQVSVQIAVYIIIWSIEYALYKREIANLNQDIKSFKMRKSGAE